jgi:curved DNA-binding protein CbpA
MLDLYSILEVPRRANSAEIRAAYRALAKQSHPDVNAGNMEAEQRTKDINSAYEILGDPEMRAAYDVKLARYRAKERRSFWSATATGAGLGSLAVLLTMATLSVTVTWRQNAEIRKSPTDEPTLLVGIARSERVVAKPSTEDRASFQSAGSGESNRGDVPSEPVNAPLPLAFGELPAANPQVASASLPNEEAKTRDEAAVPLSPIRDRPPNEEVASASPSALTSVAPVQETSPGPSAHTQDPGTQTRFAAAAPPEADKRLGTPAVTASQRPNTGPERRDAHPGRVMIKPLNKKSGERTNAIETARTPPPGRQPSLEREPRLVSSNAMALRWPSADEPFVNMGGRSR